MLLLGQIQPEPTSTERECSIKLQAGFQAVESVSSTGRFVNLLSAAKDELFENGVFPGANDKNRPMSNNIILFAMYHLGYEGRMTGHGFRGLASTVLHENEFDDEHIELQLAH